MRSLETDAAIEARFGKPDWTRSFIEFGMLLTPFKNYKLWRVDPIVSISNEVEESWRVGSL